MPQLWIVAGPNGAGKTTIADRWIAPRIPVISPDNISCTQRPSPIQSGKIAIRKQERFLSKNVSFAIDTTFSGNRKIDLMKRAGAAGYKVNLIFICVSNPGICQARIEERVESGGHSVPPKDVIRRFDRSLANLTLAFDLTDRIFILDNTGEKRRLILSLEGGRIKHLSSNIPGWAQQAIPAKFCGPSIPDPETQSDPKTF